MLHPLWASACSPEGMLCYLQWGTSSGNASCEGTTAQGKWKVFCCESRHCTFGTIFELCVRVLSQMKILSLLHRGPPLSPGCSSQVGEQERLNLGLLTTAL